MCVLIGVSGTTEVVDSFDAGSVVSASPFFDVELSGEVEDDKAIDVDGNVVIVVDAGGTSCTIYVAVVVKEAEMPVDSGKSPIDFSGVIDLTTPFTKFTRDALTLLTEADAAGPIALEATLGLRHLREGGEDLVVGGKLRESRPGDLAVRVSRR